MTPSCLANFFRDLYAFGHSVCPSGSHVESLAHPPRAIEFPVNTDVLSLYATASHMRAARAQIASSDADHQLS